MRPFVRVYPENGKTEKELKFYHPLFTQFICVHNFPITATLNIYLNNITYNTKQIKILN